MFLNIASQLNISFDKFTVKVFFSVAISMSLHQFYSSLSSMLERGTSIIDGSFFQ